MDTPKPEDPLEELAKLIGCQPEDESDSRTQHVSDRSGWVPTKIPATDAEKKAATRRVLAQALRISENSASEFNKPQLKPLSIWAILGWLT